MAFTAKKFGQTDLKAWLKEFSWASDTIKIALYTGALPVNAQDTWVYKSDIATITEIANGNGYTTGGATLATKTATYDAGTNTIKFSCDNPSWAAITASFTYAIVYVQIGADLTTPADDVLLGYIDFASTQAPSGVAYTINVATAGLFTSVAA